MHEGDRSNPRDVSAEVSRTSSQDFLFHLYRGTELFEDNRVEEAKEELERAVALQPRDAKGQDLLAAVCFRMGLHARAVQLYEALRTENPGDLTLTLNLALGYIKTGQVAAARDMLEEVVRKAPENGRAWAYLGLAYRLLGDSKKASDCLERGGHDLDPGDVSFTPAEPARRRGESGTWRAVAMGTATPSARTSDASGTMVRLASPMHDSQSFSALAAAARLKLRGEELVTQHASGLVVVGGATSNTERFAGRLDALRGYTGRVETRLLQRQSRGSSAEPFGGVASPLARIKSSGTLVFGPRSAHRLVPLRLDGETVFIREEYVLGLELGLTFENGRLAAGEGESLSFVQLSGRGVVVLELLDPLVAIDVSVEDGAVLRREAIVGWTGRLLPRVLSPSELPSGQRGLITFSGEGSLFMSGR